MRSKRRLTSLLLMVLCVCLIAGTMVLNASAATAITKIRVTIDAPGFGKTPATTASVPSTANSTVEKVEWSGPLADDGTFMPRTDYKVTVTLGIKKGSNHIFSDKAINATVNGKAADDVFWYADDMVEVIYTFPQFGTGTDLTKARITLEEPAVGAKPAQTATLPSTASTYVKSVTWNGALDSNGCFQAGIEYTAIITLGVKDGLDKRFSDKTFDAEVNGVVIDAATLTRVSDKELIVPVMYNKLSGTAPAAQSGFTDVAATSPYAQAISWAVEKGITNGTSPTTFTPDGTCNQAQILTFLWRAAGSPNPQGTVKMEGFTGTEYYYQAAMWAAERDMIGGEFNPDAPCTRAMAVTYLWKQSGSPSVAAASFSDVAASADYAQAVSWAVASGITNGTGAGTFSPSSTCTRGQIATFLYRAFAN